MATQDRPSYRYEIYIGATPRDVWKGLTDGDLTQKYAWGTRFQSKLAKGDRYAFVGDGDWAVVDGEILDVQPEQRLALTWSAHWDESTKDDRASRVTYELEPAGPKATKLRVVHDDFDSETATYSGSVESWPLMLSSLKTVLETGQPLSMPGVGQ
jgi:uncharacterized protein YndB with AHSA1/START domain